MSIDELVERLEAFEPAFDSFKRIIPWAGVWGSREGMGSIRYRWQSSLDKGLVCLGVPNAHCICSVGHHFRLCCDRCQPELTPFIRSGRLQSCRAVATSHLLRLPVCTSGYYLLPRRTILLHCLLTILILIAQRMLITIVHHC